MDRICADPKCDNVVPMTGRYDSVRRYCSKRCARRANSRRHYERLSTTEKRVLNEKGAHGAPARSARWRARNKDHVAEKGWRANGMDLTVEQYMALYDAQGGRCAICQTPRPPYGNERTGLAPDHCHDTGVVRGLLCFRCNTALGVFGDTVKGLEVALRYLRREPPALLTVAPKIGRRRPRS